MLMYAFSNYAFCIIIAVPSSSIVCGETGPGNAAVGVLSPDFISVTATVGFLAKVVLVWIALLLLHWSVPKGGSVRRGHRLVGDVVQWIDSVGTDMESGARALSFLGTVKSYNRHRDTHAVELIAVDRSKVSKTQTKDVVEVNLHHRRYFVLGSLGPMRYLLYIDLACFLLISAIAAAVLWVANSRGDLQQGWQWRASLLCAQIMYSLCAFPFFIAAIPPFKMVLTHARKTGYNKHGTCVSAFESKDYSWVKS
jgi:hypothetical protein